MLLGAEKMYRYFHELDNPNNFNIYLENDAHEISDVHINNVKLSEDFLSSYKYLFERINTIDMLINGSNEQLLEIGSRHISYEESNIIHNFFEMKNFDYYFTKKV